MIKELTSTPVPAPTLPTSSSACQSATSYSPVPSVAYEDYTTQIQLKRSSLFEHNVVYRNYLSTLVNTPLEQITEDMVINLYFENCKRSVAQSNKAMKILQTVIRFSGLISNPCTVLARRRLQRHISHYLTSPSYTKGYRRLNMHMYDYT